MCVYVSSLLTGHLVLHSLFLWFVCCQENASLSSQLSAQGSVMDGLRGERELWSRELAQQGAELAQDRGRMEAQIEALTSENASLREELQVMDAPNSIAKFCLKSGSVLISVCVPLL